MKTTAEFLMDVRSHFIAAETQRRSGGAYDASEGSDAALAIQAASRNMKAAGFDDNYVLSVFRAIANDVVRSFN